MKTSKPNQAPCLIVADKTAAIQALEEKAIPSASGLREK